MKYKCFSVLYDKILRRWIVVVDCFTQWLATSKEDAIRQIDEHLSRKIIRVAA